MTTVTMAQVEAAVSKAQNVIGRVPAGKCAAEKAYLERLVSWAGDVMTGKEEPVYLEELVAALEEGAKGLSYLAGVYQAPVKAAEPVAKVATPATKVAEAKTAEVVLAVAQPSEQVREILAPRAGMEIEATMATAMPAPEVLHMATVTTAGIAAVLAALCTILTLEMVRRDAHC